MEAKWPEGRNSRSTHITLKFLNCSLWIPLREEEPEVNDTTNDLVGQTEGVIWCWLDDYIHGIATPKIVDVVVATLLSDEVDGVEAISVVIVIHVDDLSRISVPNGEGSLC